MTGSQVSAFTSAMESAEITNFETIDDMGGHYYHGGSNIIKIDSGKELFINIRTTSRQAAVKTLGNNLEITAVDFTDMHGMRVAGTANQIKKFMESIGNDLSEDEFNLILQLDGSNYNLNPETGDYNNTFTYLSQKQYDALSQEDKESYDSEKAAFEKAKEEALGARQAASITF